MNEKTVSQIVGQTVKMETANGTKSGIVRGTHQGNRGRLFLIEHRVKENGREKTVKNWYHEGQVA